MDNETKKQIEMITKKNKDFKVQEVVILVAITCIFSFFAGSSYSRLKYIGNNYNKLTNKNIEMSEELVTFVENYQHIIENYYEELDEEKLLDAAFAAVVNELNDPYSIYMNESDYSNLNISLEGNYEGLGIAIYKEKQDGNVIVSYVFDGSPASKAGLQADDIILSVNGKTTETMTTSEVSEMILSGTSDEYILEIERNSKKIEIKLNKANIEIQSIEHRIYEKNNKKIGYIYVSIFANNTYSQFKLALEELEAEGIDSLIIDVRSNTGGHLTAVYKMISLFVDSKHIAYQLEQDGKVEKIYSTGTETKQYPIVFLADSYSASASEVFITSLRDNLSAKLIGTKTYGKGTVQELITLSNGDQYKITTKKWLTPNGSWVNDTEGVVPDIEVTLSDKYYDNPIEKNDNQLNRALDELSK